jgi:hypothetical protein
VFLATTSSIAALTFETVTSFDLSTTRTLQIDNVNRTDIRPNLGTARQLLRTLPVAGTARTQGRLAVEHATSALGDVIVYAYPDDDSGYVPPLRTYYRTAGSAPTTDTSLVSGARDDLGTPTVFTVPARRLPSGGHLAMALLRSNTELAAVAPYTVNVQTVTYVGTAQVSTLRSTNISVSLSGTTWSVVPLTRWTLPEVDVAEVAPNCTVFVQIGGANVQLDEMWLFSAIGRLTVASCGTASPAVDGGSNRLWIEPATTAKPRPLLRRGYSADGSDAYHAVSSSWQFPEFRPPSMKVLSVTTNATNAAVTLRHYPRWLFNAAS